MISDERKAQLKGRYEMLKANGLCVACGKVEVTGGVKCGDCQSHANENSVRFQGRRKAMRICRACAKPLDGDSIIYCVDHTNASNAKERRKRADAQKRGLCGECGKRRPAKGGKSCWQCREAARKKAARRAERLKKAGLCYSCGKRESWKKDGECSVCREKSRLKANAQKRRPAVKRPRKSKKPKSFFHGLGSGGR